MEQYEKKTQKVLRQLGANGSYLGFYYIAFGIAKSIENPELLTYICKGLYAEIAEHFHVNTKNVEFMDALSHYILNNYGEDEK